MKRVAFDVQGTLKGYDQEKVLKLFNYFKAHGCKMIVWSWGGASMAYDCIMDLDLDALPAGKESLPGFYDDEDKDYRYVDICIDDEDSAKEILSAHTVILVREIPEDESLFDKKFGHLIGRGYENPRID